ncbi:MAG: hypothetical protein J6I65_02470, partial [Lachnospiraceae bacterium]|nr:hypothetical protein [Lachnospiraceae bacterium]
MRITDFILGGLTAIVLFCFVAAWLYVKFKRKQAETRIAVDKLTGLPAKQQHKLLVSEALKNQQGSYAYVSCDIIDFKCFNEAYG